MTQRVYPLARLLDVHDGDTVKLDVDLGFSTHAYIWLRLRGVRAPELATTEGQLAREECRAWFDIHAPDGYVQVTTFQTRGLFKEIREQRTFIRYVGVVAMGPGGPTLNDYLITERGYTDQGA